MRVGETFFVRQAGSMRRFFALFYPLFPWRNRRWICFAADLGIISSTVLAPETEDCAAGHNGSVLSSGFIRQSTQRRKAAGEGDFSGITHRGTVASTRQECCRGVPCAAVRRYCFPAPHGCLCARRPLGRRHPTAPLDKKHPASCAGSRVLTLCFAYVASCTAS